MTAQSDTELFQAIDELVRKERLYADPGIKRQDIMSIFGLRRQRLNRILEICTSHSSFPYYINTLRLEEAERLIKNYPDMLLSEVAEYVGFSIPNFRIAFKQRYGMSPMDFRNATQKKIGQVYLYTEL